MDGRSLFGLYFTHVVHRLAENVQHTSECFLANRNRDRLTQIKRLHAAY